MGPEEWKFVVEHARHSRRGRRLRAGIAAGRVVFGAAPAEKGERLSRQLLPRSRRIRAAIRPRRRLLDETLDVVDANWRGIGIIPRSGYALKPAYAEHDARLLLPRPRDAARKRAGEMPPGCDCAQRRARQDLSQPVPLYGKACTPRNPIGPCMVSDEGACRIWWAGGVRVSRRCLTGATAHGSASPSSGRVQGVGFRPFVYRMAQQASDPGWVRNVHGEVEIHAEGRARRNCSVSAMRLSARRRRCRRPAAVIGRIA